MTGCPKLNLSIKHATKTIWILLSGGQRQDLICGETCQVFSTLTAPSVLTAKTLLPTMKIEVKFVLFVSRKMWAFMKSMVSLKIKSRKYYGMWSWQENITFLVMWSW